MAYSRVPNSLVHVNAFVLFYKNPPPTFCPAAAMVLVCFSANCINFQVLVILRTALRLKLLCQFIFAMKHLKCEGKRLYILYGAQSDSVDVESASHGYFLG